MGPSKVVRIPVGRKAIWANTTSLRCDTNVGRSAEGLLIQELVFQNNGSSQHTSKDRSLRQEGPLPLSLGIAFKTGNDGGGAAPVVNYNSATPERWPRG